MRAPSGGATARVGSAVTPRSDTMSAPRGGATARVGSTAPAAATHDTTSAPSGGAARIGFAPLPPLAVEPAEPAAASPARAAAAPAARRRGRRGERNVKPGFSLMDWNRRAGAATGWDARAGGPERRVARSELAGHASPRDCWIALRGRVYNATPYLPYHPGGEEIIRRCGGRDGTAAFDAAHRYVNGHAVLLACYVGPLVDEDGVPVADAADRDDASSSSSSSSSGS